MAFFENMMNKASAPPPRPTMPNVNPPAAASAPVGRPPLPPTPFPGVTAGSSLPLTGSGGAAPAAPGASFTPKPPSAQRAVKGRGPGGESAMGQPMASPAPPVTTTPASFSVQFDRIPTAAERAELPPGTSVQTPYGVMGPDGMLTPTPEGQQLYRQAMVKAQKDFGPHPWAGDPSAPQPPVKLGRSNFNPFTGQWSQS